MRLAPPLLVTMLFAISLVLLGIAEGALDPATITSQIFFYYNYFSLHGGGDSSVDGLSVLWSLAVEEHFYLLYPWLFLLLAANRIGLRSIGLILLALLLWRMVRFYVFGQPEWPIYISTDTRIDGILYGCFLALMIAKGQARRWMPDKALYPLIFGGIVLLLVTFAIRDDAFRSTIRYSIQGIALIPISYFATQRSELWLFRPLNWTPVRRVGQYSYTFYLVHSVIIKALEYNGVLTGNALMFTLVAGVLCLIYSALVFEFVEKPFKPLRQRLTGH
ncbi:MAG: acyltransferase [Pseudomonadota bacterium]